MDARLGERIKAGVGVAVLHIVLGYALITGLAQTIATRASESLKLFNIEEPEPPPETVIPEKILEPESPPPKATPLVRPEPIVKIDPAPTITATPEPDTGSASTPGTSAAGSGSGTGSGGGLAAKPRLIRGQIRNRDYPRDASRANAQGTVVVRYTVDAEGRARGCSVMRSSGNAALDSTTCRLIERRFRYDPARDAQGRPVASETGWQQRWWLED